MKKIWVNCVVKNEENFIWFAITSVVDYVDKILVYDTGSKDKTVEIVKEIQKIKKGKIDLTEVGDVDKHMFAKIRQEMLDRSNCDWILILDGDEVWWDKSIKKLVNTINKKGDKLDAIVTPFINAVGDIYHFQPQNAGKYELAGRKGHLTIRAINRKISGLHTGGPYGSESYLDKNNIPIQKRDPKRIFFLDAPFLHLTHLKRSGNDDHGKYKYEEGYVFDKKFKYPEVFYQNYTSLVRSPWIKMTKVEEFKAMLLTPLRKAKRKIL